MDGGGEIKSSLYAVFFNSVIGRLLLWWELKYIAMTTSPSLTQPELRLAKDLVNGLGLLLIK